MSLEELWFQTSDMNTQRSSGGKGGGGGNQPCLPWIRHRMISFQCDEDQKNVRNEQNVCLLIKQREDGKKHENKRFLTRALPKPPFFDAQLIYFIH